MMIGKIFLFISYSVLLSHGADANAKDYRSYTPLFYASNNFCLEILIELLETGGVDDVNHKSKNGKTALSKTHNYDTLMILRYNYFGDCCKCPDL